MNFVCLKKKEPVIKMRAIFFSTSFSKVSFWFSYMCVLYSWICNKNLWQFLHNSLACLCVCINPAKHSSSTLNSFSFLWLSVCVCAVIFTLWTDQIKSNYLCVSLTLFIKESDILYSSIQKPSSDFHNKFIFKMDCYFKWNIIAQRQTLSVCYVMNIYINHANQA